MVLHCCSHPSQLTYLPPPWGDCKATPMDSDFFSTYSITACRIDCETRYLVENCNCRMVHMPGREQKGKGLLDIDTVSLLICAAILLIKTCCGWRSFQLKSWWQKQSWRNKLLFFFFASDCRKSDTFTLHWIGKTKLLSICVCAVIIAGICWLPPKFNHCVAPQSAH